MASEFTLPGGSELPSLPTLPSLPSLPSLPRIPWPSWPGAGDGEQLPNDPGNALPPSYPEIPIPGESPFDPNRFRDVISRLTQRLTDVGHGVDDWVRIATDLATYIYQTAVAPLIDWIRNAVKGFANILALIADVAAAYPVGYRAYDLHSVWADAKYTATNAGGHLTPQPLQTYQHWPSGDARDAYLRSTASQSAAATALGNVSIDVTADRLARVAGYALIFYTGVLSALSTAVGSILAEVGKLAAARRGGGSADGAAAIINSGMSVANVAAQLADRYFTLVGSLIIWVDPGVKLSQVDASAFPDGTWPDPHADNYSCAVMR